MEYIYSEQTKLAMRQLLIDLETYTNYFMLGVKDYKTKEVFDFQIRN